MPAISSDARAMMLYENQKKSVGVSYLLWAFLGGAGGHRFYNGRPITVVTILLLNVFGLLTAAFVVGIPLLLVAWIWILIDAFNIPGWVRRHNLKLIRQLEANGSAALLIN